MIYSLLRVRDYGLARELWIRLEEDETTFAEAAVSLGKVRKRTDRVSSVQSQLGPAADLAPGYSSWAQSWRAICSYCSEWQLLLRLEKLTPARLDDQVRDQMLQESLDKFLNDE